MSRGTLSFMLAVVFAITAQTSYGADTLQKAIQAREDQWSAAFNAHDADKVAAIYADDAVLLAPGSLPVRGHAEIAKKATSFFSQLRDLKLIADEVRPLGADHAVEIGHSEYQAVGADGKLSPGVDNYVVVWHKANDGVWYYVTDIFNTR
jgi:uncharacterized protein (TIGR02246 family)